MKISRWQLVKFAALTEGRRAYGLWTNHDGTKVLESAELFDSADLVAEVLAKAVALADTCDNVLLLTVDSKGRIDRHVFGRPIERY